MTRVVLSPRALREADEASRWYDERGTGLGKKFIDALDEALKRVQESPEACQRIVGRFRKYGLRRFPYYIIFELQSDSVRVLSILHSARNPTELQKVLRDN